MQRFGYQPFYIGKHNFYPTYAGVGIQKNAVKQISHSSYETQKSSALFHFQTFQLQVEKIAQRLWEGGIPDKLIKYYIPPQFLIDEKMEAPPEAPFQVLFIVCYP